MNRYPHYRIGFTTIVVFTVLASITAPAVAGDESFDLYPMAIFPFSERGVEVTGHGAKVADLLFANLVVRPDLILVERTQIDTMLKEVELGLSGVVTADQAARVGHLTGAKILLTGSVFQIDQELYVVAKIIGTETSRVFGRSVKGAPDELSTLAEQLANLVGDAISQDSSSLVAPQLKVEDRISALAKQLGSRERPIVEIKINERHVGGRTMDPAAETELALFCRGAGFKVIDHSTDKRGQADVKIEGEAFSEFATRRGNLVSVMARLEVKAIDRATGEVIAIDRRTAVVVDLAEQIAGKKALQNAAAEIAEVLLPKIVR